MTPFKTIWRSNFLIKLRHWEYWPFGILQFPVFIYYLWLSARARSFLFFTASNPGIEMGGMLGESKYRILEKIPDLYKAKTVFVPQGHSLPEVLKKMTNANLSFPVVAKPDLGERGHEVKRIYSETDLALYIRHFRFDFLIQELVDLPLEFGVFYKRLPSQPYGEVFSIVGKEMLSVTGDGQSTLRQLIMEKDRAKLQWKRLQHIHVDVLHGVIRKGEEFILNPIGNHCLGTTFLNKNNLINPTLNRSFDTLSKQIEGFYYGRFDLRCASIDDLNHGRVKIMELNGCGAEPAHIYQPGYSFWVAVYEMIRHWKTIFDIAQTNNKKGVAYLTLPQAKVYYQKFKHTVQR